LYLCSIAFRTIGSGNKVEHARNKIEHKTETETENQKVQHEKRSSSLEQQIT